MTWALEHREVPAAELPEAARALWGGGEAGRLLTVVGHDRRPTGFDVEFYFSHGGNVIRLWSRLDPARPRYPSVTPEVPAAHWHERELRDLYGIVPEGHPDPRRLVMHADWPEGLFPLRRDFDLRARPPRVEGAFQPVRAEGEGVHEIPVGPIHAGIIEPGHFRFQALGDVPILMEAQLFYTHRGLEKAAEGLDLDRGLMLAERVCGLCALSNAVAYCQAVETLAGPAAAPPPRAQWIRLLLCELERLYNHLRDLGQICAGGGFMFGASHCHEMAERVQRLNEEVFGHRFMRGTVQPGGVRRDLSAEAASRMGARAREVANEVKELYALAVETESFRDRVETCGVLVPEAARDLGAVGPGARGSGLARDARRDTPYGAYATLGVRVQTQEAGDCLARARVRLDEIEESVQLIERGLAGMPAGGLGERIARVPAGAALGIVEGPRGEGVHYLEVGEDGRIARYKVRTASYMNWPVVTVATVNGNIVADAPLVNKSFNLCYACVDR